MVKESKYLLSFTRKNLINQNLHSYIFYKFMFCSVAAVAGAVFFLSERTRAVGAAAAAALLPTAMAFGTASTTRISNKMTEEQEKSNFDELIKRLLGDMQLFKKLVRKCLNLLQGMELIHGGHVLAINSVTGGPSASIPAGNTSEKEQSSLSKGILLTFFSVFVGIF